jgi:hypothetical protein
MTNITTPALSTPDTVRARLHRTAATTSHALGWVSAIAGAIFAFLAWQDTSLSGTRENTGEIVHLIAKSLEREEQKLAAQRLTLELLERMQRETEKTCLAIERLPVLNGRGLAEADEIVGHGIRDDAIARQHTGVVND